MRWTCEDELHTLVSGPQAEPVSMSACLSYNEVQFPLLDSFQKVMEECPAGHAELLLPEDIYCSPRCFTTAIRIQPYIHN